MFLISFNLARILAVIKNKIVERQSLEVGLGQ